MKFVNSKSTILIGTILVIIALSITFTSSSEVVSSATTSTESTIKSKLQIKSNSKSRAKAHLKLQSQVHKEKVYSLDTPPGAPVRPTAKPAAAPAAPAKKENTPTQNASAGKDIILSDWLMVASRTFKNNAVFPEIYTGFQNTNVRIKTDGYDFRINDAHKKDANQNNNPAQEKHFWFRLTKEMIFYSSTKEDLNVLGGNKIADITYAALVKKHELGYFCFSINDKSRHDWKICSELERTRNIWYCGVQKLRDQKVEKFCANLNSNGDSDGDGEGENANIVYKNVKNKIYLSFFCVYNLKTIEDFFVSKILKTILRINK
jgi:hypothetical protein